MQKTFKNVQAYLRKTQMLLIKVENKMAKIFKTSMSSDMSLIEYTETNDLEQNRQKTLTHSS